MVRSVGRLLKGVIMGPPGSGKGTISEKILKKFDVVHVSTGDILRQNISEKTKIGEEAKKYISDGELVPDVLMNEIVVQKLKTLTNKSFLLDGYPRTVNQAKKLYEVQPVNLVINLNVAFDVIVERVKNRRVHVPSGRVYHTEFKPPKVPGKDDVTGEPLIQRPDDQPEAVRKRLKVYAEITKPVIDFYKEKTLLLEFAGSSTDEIWSDLEKKLDEFMKEKS